MNVIAVDDEQFSLRSLRTLLLEIPEVTGIHCFLQEKEALRYLEDHALEAALLDMELSNGSGLHLAAGIKEKCPDCAVIFVTGYSIYAMEAQRRHPCGYLLKPVDIEELACELQNTSVPYSKTGQMKRIRVQTFGAFELYVDEIKLEFRREIEKELLAFLIYRRGFPAEFTMIGKALRNRRGLSSVGLISSVAAGLRKTLKEAGAQPILRIGFCSLGLDLSQFDCDYFDFLRWKTGAVNAYRGEFMNGYDWAGFTLGRLNEHTEHTVHGI